jgi:DNA-binding NtrC family response regulator
MTDELELCRSDAMQSVRDVVARVADTKATVLLLGESGVGKEVVAHAIHRAPPRAGHPFLPCGSRPSCFTFSRTANSPGWAARRSSTVMSGSSRRRTATWRRSEDLSYRLNVIAVRIPPLRTVIPALAGYFLRRFNMAYGRSVAISPETMRTFTDYSWPGNIRELENAVKRVGVLGAALLVRRELVSTSDPGTAPALSSGGNTFPTCLKIIAREAARAAERIAIEATLVRVDWNRVKAAQLLQISYAALRYKIVDCGLARRGPENEGPIVT